MRVKDDADAPSAVRPHRVDNLERKEASFPSFSRFGAQKSEGGFGTPYYYIDIIRL